MISLFQFGVMLRGMNMRSCWVVGLIWLSILHNSPVQAIGPYFVTDLGDLPGGNDYSYALGINASGQVVGESSIGSGHDGVRAFLWQPTSTNGIAGTMVSLGESDTGCACQSDVNQRSWPDRWSIENW